MTIPPAQNYSVDIKQVNLALITHYTLYQKTKGKLPSGEGKKHRKQKT